MFGRIIAKMSDFADHHQIFFTVLIAFCIICISWAVERIFDEYIFPHKPLHGYLITIAGALLMLWVIKHVILHAM